jgi:hypothetical protein
VQPQAGDTDDLQTVTSNAAWLQWENVPKSIPNSWRVYFREKSIYKWMIKMVPLFLGNLHMDPEKLECLQ